MKKKIILIISITLILLVGISLILYIHKEHSKDSYRFKREYEKINNTKREKDGKTIRAVKIDYRNPMKYASAEDIIRMMDEKKTFLVYFGFSDCPWCRSIISNLIQVSKEKNLNTVYYVDVSKIRDIKVIQNNQIVTSKKGTKGYIKLVQKMSNILDPYILINDEGMEIDTLEKRIYAPNIVAVVNGRAEEMTDGISSKLTDPYMKLTKEMNRESIKKIECILNCLEKANVCTQKTSC